MYKHDVFIGIIFILYIYLCIPIYVYIKCKNIMNDIVCVSVGLVLGGWVPKNFSTSRACIG